MKMGGVEVWLLVFLTLALDAGEWSASHPSHFTAGERAPCTHWRGGFMDPKSGSCGKESPWPYQEP